MKKLLVVLITLAIMAGNAWAAKPGADGAEFVPVNERLTQRLLALAGEVYGLVPNDGLLRNCGQMDGSLTGFVSGTAYYNLSVCDTSIAGTVSYNNYSNEPGIVISGALDLALSFDDLYAPRYVSITLNGGPLTVLVYGQSYTVSMQNMMITVDAYTGQVSASGTYVVNGQPFSADAAVAGLLL